MNLSPIILLSILLSLMGCATSEEEPKGIGAETDALKKSVCPCGEVFYRNGAFI